MINDCESIRRYARTYRCLSGIGDTKTTITAAIDFVVAERERAWWKSRGGRLDGEEGWEND